MLNHYLVIKTEVDRNENITTDVIIKYRKVEAEVEFYSLIDAFYRDLAFKEQVQFEELDIADFGDEIRNNYVFEFKDYEGEINLKIEMKTI
jgi:hypothetical protein